MKKRCRNSEKFRAVLLPNTDWPTLLLTEDFVIRVGAYRKEDLKLYTQIWR